MKTRISLIALALSLGGCTAQDVDATFGAIDHGISSYRNARSAYYGDPYQP